MLSHKLFHFLRIDNNPESLLESFENERRIVHEIFIAKQTNAAPFQVPV